MKKIIFGIALLFSVLVIATGFTENPANKKVNIGSTFPTVRIHNTEGVTTLGDRKSHYTLITFWESSDAQSRMECNIYDKALSSSENADVEFIAVNFDGTKTLFDEIVTIDNMQQQRQYHVTGQTAMELRAIFDLDKGMGSILLAPDGTVAAFNPSVDYLMTLKA